MWYCDEIGIQMTTCDKSYYKSQDELINYKFGEILDRRGSVDQGTRYNRGSEGHN